MSFHPKACVKIVRLCMMMAAAHGLDVPRLLREYGLDPEGLADPYTRVSHQLVYKMWQEVPARVGDVAFGLHAAERLHDMTLDAFDAAIKHCSTFGEIWQLLSRTVRLMHEAAVVEVLRQGDLIRCTERWLPPASIPPHLGEMIMAMWVLRGRRMLAQNFVAHEITFMHPAPADLSEHKRVFAGPLRFSAETYSVALPAAFADAPVQGADPVLRVVLDRHLQQELQHLPPADDFLTAALRTAKDALTDPQLDIAQMARRLHTSERTLQRRLREAGTSCQALIEKARREQVLQLLRDPRLTLAEVAFMTGYAEMSTFYRAFRRWTGQTPREYRDRAAQ